MTSETTPDPDDVSMADIAEAGLALDALAAAAHGPGAHEPADPGMRLLLALQASTLRAEVERDESRRPTQAAAAALDALAEGRGQDIPEVAPLAALRDAIDRGVEATPFHVVRRNTRRRRVLATAAIAAVFSVGGVTAAAAASQPGDELYPLRIAVLGRVNSDPVVSRDVLNQVSSALASQGVSTDPMQAAKSEALLAKAASLVPQVKDTAERAALDARLAALSSAVHERIADRHPHGPTALPHPGLTPTPGSSPTTVPQPGVTPTPGTHRHRHPMRKHPVPTTKPTRTVHPSPRPTPSRTVSPSPTSPSPSVSPSPPVLSPTPVKTKKTSPTPSASTPTSSPSVSNT